MQGLTLITGFLADFNRPPFETDELAARGFIPFVIAVIVFWLGIKLQHRGKPKWIKWLAVVPLVIGVFIGIEPFQMAFLDETYKRLYGGGGKWKMMHAAGIWAPVVAMIGFLVWNWWLERQKFEEL